MNFIFLKKDSNVYTMPGHSVFCSEMWNTSWFVLAGSLGSSGYRPSLGWERCRWMKKTWLVGLYRGWLRSTPHPVTVTTRIITFLVGNPYKHSFATVTGWEVDPRDDKLPSYISGLFHKPLFLDPKKTNQYFMESRSRFFRESQVNEVNMSSCTVTYATNCFNAKRQWFRSVSPWDGCCWGGNSRHLGNHANCDYAWRRLPL